MDSCELGYISQHALFSISLLMPVYILLAYMALYRQQLFLNAGCGSKLSVGVRNFFKRM